MTDADASAANSGGKSRGWVGWAQVGLLALLIAAGIYFARAPSVPPLDEGPIRSAEAPTVRVLQPVIGSHALTVTLTGEVAAQETVALQPLAAGRVIEVSPSLRPGRTFRAGETLLVIDPTKAELALERARGRLDEVRGRLRHFQDRGAREAEEYRRRNPGAKVPPSVAQLGQIERFEGQVRTAMAAVKQAEIHLSDTQFSMPFDGTVISAPVSVGQVVAIGGPQVGTVFRTGLMEVRAPIPVPDLAYLGDPRGQPATVLAGGGRFAAVVSNISSVLAPRTRLSTLLLDFADTDAVLPPPGSFAQVSLVGPTFDNSRLLPPEAHRPGGSLWVVDDGKLQRRTPNTLGRTDTGWIVADFDTADGVVVGAMPGQRAGLAVRAIAEDAAQ